MRHVARDSTCNTRHATHGTGQMRPATRATRDTRHTRHTRRASTNATLDVGSTMGGARGCARRVLQPSIHKYRPKLTPRHSTCDTRDKRDTRGARDTCETCDTPHEREKRDSRHDARHSTAHRMWSATRDTRHVARDATRGTRHATHGTRQMRHATRTACGKHDARVARDACLTCDTPHESERRHADTRHDARHSRAHRKMERDPRHTTCGMRFDARPQQLVLERIKQK